MWADRVAIPPPGFNQHLCLGKAVEEFAIEQFVAMRPVDPMGGAANLSLWNGMDSNCSYFWCPV